jgi:hypothetical protein
MFEPRPIDTSSVVLDPALCELTEILAENVHNVWAQSRIEQGWTYGSERSDAKKTTPCLVPYNELPETEKEYDRRTAAETLKLIITLGYNIEKE